MTQNKWIALVVVVLLAIAAYIWGPGLMAQINPSGDGNNEAGTGTVDNPYRMTIGKVWTFTCPDGKIKTKRQKNGDVTLSCVAKKVSKKGGNARTDAGADFRADTETEGVYSGQR